MSTISNTSRPSGSFTARMLHVFDPSFACQPYTVTCCVGFSESFDQPLRVSVFGGYLFGAALMIAAAAVAWRYAVSAERKSLESVAKPLASVE